MQDGNVGRKRGRENKSSRAYTRVERYFILPESGMYNI